MGSPPGHSSFNNRSTTPWAWLALTAKYLGKAQVAPLVTFGVHIGVVTAATLVDTQLQHFTQ